MSNNQIIEMSKVIGQIEDELRDIKSAKEQAEAVVGSNKALSDSLQALFETANNVAKVLETNTRQIIADISNKLELLNIQASDIDKYARQGVIKISEQSTLAQSKMEEELGNLVQKLIGTISTSTNQSLEAVGNELAEHRVLVHEAAKKLTDSTSDVIVKQEGQITEIGNLVACIQERQYVLDSKIEELRQLDIMRLFDEISESRRIESDNAAANKDWTNSISETLVKQEGQIAEIGKLMNSIQERQYALDSKIEEMRQMDIMRIFDEINEIRTMESDNAAVNKKWKIAEFGAFGICIVLGVSILIRLLVM
ncbi:hypothetical protein [Anoxynatronum sibiricum]|uniref:Uncharacterized protein n=1 Tax=Anoxynatronum sibiricum TaxID=210623 RepID=A0ABU9VTB3_9CLOT